MTRRVAATDFARALPCTVLRDRLEAFVLGDLAEDRAQRLERHLAACEPCRSLVRAERELFALLPQALPHTEPPPEVLVDLLARVRGERRRLRRRSLSVGAALAACGIAAILLLSRPLEATSSLMEALRSPDVAIISLFVALDSPLSARYEYRTESDVLFDRSVGRLLYDVGNGRWHLVVHGLPRPPRGGRYVLSASVEGHDVELGRLERWEDGVALLSGRTETDLTGTERVSLELVSTHSRLRLLDAVDGAW
jgi:hypothetical protein